MGFFVDDDCTLTETIEARPPLWTEPLKISWRPPTSGDGDKLRQDARSSGDNEEAYGKVVRKFILDRLTEWSAGREITEESIALLHESLTEEIFRLVRGAKKGVRLTEGN